MNTVKRFPAAAKHAANNQAAMNRTALSLSTREEARVILPWRPPLGAAMLSDLVWREIARSLHLSPRELQIVRATFDDCKESAIAAELGIAPRTVHTHIERLHRKLLVGDRLQLVLRIMYEFLRLTISPQGKLPPTCSNAAAGCCPLRG
jgi:DNA-binding NarL/FixJ family response regulator